MGSVCLGTERTRRRKGGAWAQAACTPPQGGLQRTRVPALPPALHQSAEPFPGAGLAHGVSTQARWDRARTWLEHGWNMACPHKGPGRKGHTPDSSSPTSASVSSSSSLTPQSMFPSELTNECVTEEGRGVGASQLVGGQADTPFPGGSFVSCIEALTMNTLSPESPAAMDRSEGGNQMVGNVNLSDIHSLRQHHTGRRRTAQRRGAQEPAVFLSEAEAVRMLRTHHQITCSQVEQCVPLKTSII